MLTWPGPYSLRLLTSPIFSWVFKNAHNITVNLCTNLEMSENLKQWRGVAHKWWILRVISWISGISFLAFLYCWISTLYWEQAWTDGHSSNRQIPLELHGVFSLSININTGIASKFQCMLWLIQGQEVRCRRAVFPHVSSRGSLGVRK